MAQTETEGGGQRKEVHRASAHASTRLEQISHALCRHVERANGIEHPHQGLDRDVLELDACPHHWAGNSREWRAWESSACVQGKAVVVTYTCGEILQESPKNRETSSYECTNQNLCSRFEYERTSCLVY